MGDPVLAPEAGILRVCDVTAYLKQLVSRDDVLSALSVRGEVSDVSRAPSGHVYFALRDATSQIQCALFRREAVRQPDDLRELKRGAAVVVHGFLTVYEAKGTCQVYVERVVVQGEGALLARVARLRDRLEREGLFASERKRPLPRFPRCIALITSPRSQAYFDVLHRLRQQYPFAEVVEAGASVQGHGAADEMAMAIDIVNRLTDADLILLVRGGGAPEELMAFNEERLARAIFGSRIPVVTGIGHESDETIADAVADVRAATPSLAAANAVPDIRALVQQSARVQDQIRQGVQSRMRHARQRLLGCQQSLLRSSPQSRLQRQRQRSAELDRTLARMIDLRLRTKRSELNALQARLSALDPLAILDRGYAVVTDESTGRVISRAHQAETGALLTVRVSDGRFSVRVAES